MWNSFGSSGSMSPYTQPLDIPYSSASSRSSAYQPNCAFPSWPQGPSLGSSSRPHYERATSYLSDDDLFWQDSENDDAHSVSSAGSGGASHHGSAYAVQQPTEEELAEQRLEEQRKRAQMQRDALRFVKLEKERRRLAAQQQKPRRSNSSSNSKKSSNMTSIREAAE
ncbi:hypothetical protein PG990_002642 [Apiospora arundinis]|uniref:Uncharacterized protein n=1 Tax=Apiospora arundinis TaxID=335852 RepID=A0ABR2IJC4_9PEZI